MKMRYPNVVDLGELSRRNGSAIDILNDIFSSYQLVKINRISVFHKICIRILDNYTIFSNCQLVAKVGIINAINKYQSSQISNIEK